MCQNVSRRHSRHTRDKSLLMGVLRWVFRKCNAFPANEARYSETLKRTSKMKLERTCFDHGKGFHNCGMCFSNFFLCGSSRVESNCFSTLLAVVSHRRSAPIEKTVCWLPSGPGSTQTFSRCKFRVNKIFKHKPSEERVLLKLQVANELDICSERGTLPAGWKSWMITFCHTR